MIVAANTCGERTTFRTLYEVKCDKCGSIHPEAAVMPDDSVRNAQHSGWHVPSLMPGDDWTKTPVTCPKCRR